MTSFGLLITTLYSLLRHSIVGIHFSSWFLLCTILCANVSEAKETRFSLDLPGGFAVK